MTLRSAVAALPTLILGVPLWATWNGDAVTALLKVTSTVVLLASAVRPRYGLMMVAALLPLATQIQVLSGSPFSGAETAELILVPFLFAATLRASLSAPAQPTRLGWPALLLATTALASAIVELFVTAGPPILPTLGEHYNRTYYSDPASFGNLRYAIRWTEGLLLAVIAERTLRHDPAAREAVTRLLIIGALAAAAFAVLRLSEVSIRTLEPWSTAYRYLRTLRINPHYGDANAAGSFYVLFLAPAVWLAWQRGWRWLLPFLPIGLLALSMTGSRAAIGAGVIGVAVAWSAYRRPRPRVLVLALSLTLLASTVLVSQYSRNRAAPSTAAGIRVELGMIGLRLTAERPLFGVGIGRFKSASAASITPQFAERFPAAARGENAHNQFVQIAAELGMVGFFAFVWLLAIPAHDLGVAIATTRAAAGPTAMACGLLAFLLTCLMGHPLLVVQVLFPFFAALGAATAWGTHDPARTATWPMRVGLIALTLVVVSVPLRVAFEPDKGIRAVRQR